MGLAPLDWLHDMPYTVLRPIEGSFFEAVFAVIRSVLRTLEWI